MKIIIENNNQKSCYIQIKDLIILAEITKNNSLIKEYLNLINHGYQNFEFLPIKNKKMIAIIKNLPDIIDFRTSKDDSIEYLSHRIINLYSIRDNTKSSKIKDLIAGDLKDIIAYKRKELSYKIPAIPDGKFHLENKEHSLAFDSTIIEDCYLLRSLNREELDKETSFLNSAIEQVYQTFYPKIPKEERKYQSYYYQDHLFLMILNSKEKKQSRIGKILSKLKRSSND